MIRKWIIDRILRIGGLVKKSSIKENVLEFSFGNILYFLSSAELLKQEIVESVDVHKETVLHHFYHLNVDHIVDIVINDILKCIQNKTITNIDKLKINRYFMHNDKFVERVPNNTNDKLGCDNCVFDSTYCYDLIKSCTGHSIPTSYFVYSDKEIVEV